MLRVSAIAQLLLQAPDVLRADDVNAPQRRADPAAAGKGRQQSFVAKYEGGERRLRRGRSTTWRVIGADSGGAPKVLSKVRA